MSDYNFMRNLKWFGVAAIVIILDQLSKQFVINALLLHQPMPIFPWLNLSLSYNTGAAFSMMAYIGGWQRWFLSALAVIVSIILCFWIALGDSDKKAYRFSLALILGGAVSNLIDRFIYGYVIDFVDFHIGTWHFATFNIADSAITAGAILLGILLIFKRV